MYENNPIRKDEQTALCHTLTSMINELVELLLDEAIYCQEINCKHLPDALLSSAIRRDELKSTLPDKSIGTLKILEIDLMSEIKSLKQKKHDREFKWVELMLMNLHLMKGIKS
jgi:hypothetical protein